MSSLAIANQVINLLNHQRSKFEPIQNEIARMQKDNDDDWIILEEDYAGIYENSMMKIRNKISALQKSSLSDNFYFFDCPLQTYENVYTFRFELFLKEFIDGDEKDFILSELRLLSDPTKNRLLNNGKYTCSYNEVVKNIEKYKLTIRKKKKFLFNKAQHLGFRITERSNAFVGDAYFDALKIDKFQIEKINNTTVTEQSKKTGENIKNSKPRLTANQSVILLNRLGIFEHTHFKLMAKTEQANVLSQLTGYNKKNIKSYIENLGKKKSQLGPNYQADIDKIDDLLGSLE